MKSTIITLTLLCLAIAGKAEKGVCTYVVSLNGNGDFKTIQEAVEAIPDYDERETKIFISAGVYHEKVVLPESKKNVLFIGEDKETTILSYDNYATMKNTDGKNIGTAGTATFYIYGDDFKAENMTFENTAGPIAQAVAVFVAGDRTVFQNCIFKGYHGTLYTFGKTSRQLYRNCYIEGCVDFIFGASTAFFDKCQIHCLRSGIITAASTQKEIKYGYVFKECCITAEPDVENKVYLGRPWRHYAKTVFIDCTMGDFIIPCGWNNWKSEEKEKTAFYGEYNSRDYNGKETDLSQRVTWTHAINPHDYSIDKVLSDANKPEWYR